MMLKALMTGLALMALPGAAWARDGAKLDCVVNDIRDGLKASLGRSMAAGGEDAADAVLYEEFGVAAKACIAKYEIADALQNDYVEYSLARIFRDWSTNELLRLGLSPQPIDFALDLGAGRTNPDIGMGVSDHQVDALAQKFSEVGVDFAGLDESALNLIGTYAASASIYWNLRQKLEL